MRRLSGLSINLLHDAPLFESLAWAEEIEGLGFEWLNVVDSQLLLSDAFVYSALAAARSSQLLISPMVNPLTRHPSVTASALYTLQQIAPGRVRLGIGTGDSALRGVGLRSASLDTLSEYVRAIRGLLRGEEAVWKGSRFRARWSEFSPPVEVPIYMTARGPKSLEMAVRIADGVISGFGLLPENVNYVESRIQQVAAQCDRSPADIDVWHLAQAVVADSREDGFAHFALPAASLLAKGGFVDKQVPPEFQAGITQLASQWRLDSHGRPDLRLVEMAKRSGVFDYLISRVGALIGPPEAVVTGLRSLRDRGVGQLLLLPLGAQKMAPVRLAADKYDSH